MKAFLQVLSSTARQSKQLNREADNFSSPVFNFCILQVAAFFFTSGSHLIPSAIDFEFLSSCYKNVLFSHPVPQLVLFFSSFINNWQYKNRKPEST